MLCLLFSTSTEQNSITCNSSLTSSEFHWRGILAGVESVMEKWQASIFVGFMISDDTKLLQVGLFRLCARRKLL